MKSKRMLALVLCVCLALPFSALAAPGNRVFVRGENGDLRGGIDFVCAYGDELVLLGNSLYTWKLGEERLTVYALEKGQGGERMDKNTGESVFYSENALALFTDGQELYIVYGLTENSSSYAEFQGASLYRVELEGQTAHLTQLGEVDWESESDFPMPMISCVYVDGVLYGTPYLYDAMAFSVPLDGGYAEQLEDIESPFRVYPYKDGRLLFMLWSYDDMKDLRFVAWDPATREQEEVFAMEIDPYAGDLVESFAYDAESDQLYFVRSGAVVAVSLQTGEAQQVNEISSVSEINGIACVLPGGYYVYSCFENTTVRNTDPTQRAQRSLSIYDSTYSELINAAQYEFVNRRSDVSVSNALPTKKASEIANELMTQSAEYDIYIVNTADEVYGAAHSRGYVAEIVGSDAINSFFANMYPDFAKYFSVDGVPVAIPLSAYGYSLGVNTRMLEKAGLTVEDIPTNWPELLRDLGEINAKVTRAGGSLFDDDATVKYVKGELLRQIFADYMAYRDYADPKMEFDTELLREVLSGLEEVDFAALGLQEESIDEEYSSALFADRSSVLFRISAGYTMDNIGETVQPLLLAMAPDVEPVLRIRGSVAFINPYSENKELAVEFLECVLEKMDLALVATLCDIEVEPTHSADYAKAKQKAEQELADLRANGKGGQETKEKIADVEERLANIENDFWSIHPNAIAWYRSHDGALAVECYNAINSWEGKSEINTYREQYLRGEISMEQMLKNLDRKLQMMILEQG